MASQTSLRPGEIKDILLREIEAADLNSLDVEEVGSVLEVKDGIARIYGLQKANSRYIADNRPVGRPSTPSQRAKMVSISSLR